MSVNNYMDNLRKHGQPPYRVAVIHGGPGAPGEMKPVAEELAKDHGVLEPLQTKNTIADQVDELVEVIVKQGQAPITLIGFSWGAILSFILTANYPNLVKKLILVSSAVFKDSYAADIMPTRLSRLTEEDRNKIDQLLFSLNDPDNAHKDRTFSELGQMISRVDLLNPLPDNHEKPKVQYEIYKQVWAEAEALRRSGELVTLGKNIQCPVVAIHGDYDPRPAEGVKIPLSSVIKDFQFILLEKCGHYPWLEKEAKDQLYQILKKEL